MTLVAAAMVQTAIAELTYQVHSLLTGAKTRARPSGAIKGSGDLNSELRRLIASAEGRRDRDTWLVLLDRLSATAFEVVDGDAIPVALERRRLEMILSEVTRLGARRRGSGGARLRHWWAWRQAEAAVIQAPPDISDPLAAQVLELVR